MLTQKPLSRAEMKNIKGGMGNFKEYLCGSSPSSQNIIVCLPSGETPQANCGYASCTYTTVCDSAQVSCNDGSGGGGV